MRVLRIVDGRWRSSAVLLPVKLTLMTLLQALESLSKLLACICYGSMERSRIIGCLHEITRNHERIHSSYASQHKRQSYVK